MSKIALVCFVENENVSINDCFAASGSLDPLIIEITLSIFSKAFLSPSKIWDLASASSSSNFVLFIIISRLKFKKWVSYHGFSFNLNPNLEHYSGINPCGLDNKNVTSLSDIGIEFDKEKFDEIIIEEINNIFAK